MKKRAITWARVSSNDQKEHGYSLLDQDERLKSYAKDKYDIVKSWVVDEPATNPKERPAFNKMIDFINENEIPVVLVTEQDRLSRNKIDNVTIDNLIEEGHTFILINSGDIIDKNNDNDILEIEQALSIIEIKRLRRRVKRNQAKKRREGGFIGKAPIGYLNNSGQGSIIKDTERWDGAKMIWTLAGKSIYSQRQIAKEVWEKTGLSTRSTKKYPKGKPVSKSLVQDILANKFYAGYVPVEFDDKHKIINWIKGCHEAMITLDEFLQIREIYTKRNTSSERTKKRFDFTFRGHLYCGHSDNGDGKTCGHMITAHQQNRSYGSYIYYNCSCGTRCGQRRYREEILDSMYAEEIGKLQIDEDMKKFIQKTITEYYDKDEKSIKSDATKINSRILSLEQEKERVLEAWRQGFLEDGNLLRTQLEDLERKQSLESRKITELETKNPDYVSDVLTFIKWLHDIKNKYLTSDKEEKKELISILASKAVLTNGSLLFSYRKPFNLMLRKSGYDRDTRIHVT